MTTLFRGANLDDELWDELEELLISADVGVAPTQGLLDRLKTRVREEGTTRSEDALELLKGEMVAILTMGDQQGKTPFPSTGLKTGLTFPRDGGRDKNPLVLLMVGVNGVGKTTSIAKLTNLYQEQDKKVLLGAADTFRAAAIDQLQEWGRRLGADVIAHQPGADPGAVAFDALQAARARSADVVIIDTAGRLHTKANLMEEIKKVQRVLSKQDGGQTQQVLLALDATTGQNGLLQAKAFAEALDCDGVFLAKLDGTAKGGVVVAIADQLRLPVLYIGTGEQPEDMAEFDPVDFVDALFGAGESD